MIDPKTNQNRENSGFWTLSKFGGLDQLDWLMILVSVLIGTIAKQHHFLQLPDGFLEWVLPFLLMMAGYKATRLDNRDYRSPAGEDQESSGRMKERRVCVCYFLRTMTGRTC